MGWLIPPSPAPHCHVYSLIPKMLGNRARVVGVGCVCCWRGEVVVGRRIWGFPPGSAVIHRFTVSSHMCNTEQSALHHVYVYIYTYGISDNITVLSK